MKVKQYVPWLYMAPFLILFAIFFCYPFFSGLYYSFTDYDMAKRNQFIGLSNYIKLFSKESPYFVSFWISVKNTLFFMFLSTPLLIAVPFLIANLITSVTKGRFFIGSFYISSMFSISSSMLIWFSMLGTKGVFNYFLKALFGFTVPWLTASGPAWASIVISTVWWTIGLNLVIFVAAIHGIPKELFESASLDGANGFRRLLHITIPSVKYQLTFTLVTTLIASSNLYGQPIILTRGGPGEATLSATMHIRNIAFGSAIPAGGLGSAMGITFGIMIIIITMIGMYLVGKIGRED